MNVCMNLPWHIIAELESNNSRLVKETIIRRESDAKNTEFFRGVAAALDSMVTFGIKRVPEKRGNGKGLSPVFFWKIAESLACRDLTGNAAAEAVQMLCDQANSDEWNYWYRRILIKDLRCGLSEKTVNKVAHKTYQVPVFSCQLAHDAANHQSKICGTKMVEVKLDGVRVLTIVYPSGKVDQYSRNGKELTNFAKIRQQFSSIAAQLDRAYVFDGEVMSASFQDLMRQVHRKSGAQTQDAMLHLFDIIPLENFKQGRHKVSQTERSAMLKKWYEANSGDLPNVAVLDNKLLDLDTAAGRELFQQINTDAIRGGYEGIMLKDPNADYQCKRVHSWLKIKPVLSVDLTVVAVEAGTGKNQGRLGALVCEGTDQDKFIRVNVGSGLTDEQREEIWQDQNSVIGQVVEIRADCLTKNQDSDTVYSLRFPRFERFRGFRHNEKI